MNLGLHIIKNPNGTFSFVGRVPLLLGFELKQGVSVETDANGLEEFMRSQLCLPSAYRLIKCRVFVKASEALKAADDIGVTVIGREALIEWIKENETQGGVS